MNKRTILFGDIHGALLALKQVLNSIQPTANDCFLFLGDYVDGWSQSMQVIDCLIELELKHDCVFIRGNHDTWCEEWLKFGVINDTWKFHGGKSTMASYEGVSEEKRLQHIHFFERMKDYYVDENNNLFIHAGFSSMHGPSKETYSSNYSWDRSLWETALCLDKTLTEDSVFYPKRLKLFKQIFIGHTPTTNYNIMEPMNAANVWNVDTGAAFKGKLSAMELTTKQFWQSDVVQTLYPNEMGRNKD
ncbi:MAG: serine/threonine protein phosphatase [Bacteroidia bacterium]|nr:serine/threonine protein phosphatase [Bacteroidia bacterium]